MVKIARFSPLGFLPIGRNDTFPGKAGRARLVKNYGLL